MGTENSVADKEQQVVAIILAAGGSTRLGQPKQLVPIGGEPLLRRTARTVLAAPFAQVIVVVGCEMERVSALLEDLPLTIVWNEAWRTGMASSVRCGVAAAQEAGADAALLLPCDLPRLSSFHLAALIRCYTAGALLVATAWQEKGAEVSGAPALFDRRYWPQLVALQGDQGARKLLRLHRAVLRTVAFQDATYDVDTPADLKKANE